MIFSFIRLKQILHLRSQSILIKFDTGLPASGTVNGISKKYLRNIAILTL